jgi:hypothetical protein
LPWVESGPIAIALGVSAEPITATFSLTISSWARRLELSGTPASSLMIRSSFLPAMLVPCCWVYSCTPACTCLPTGVKAAGERQNEADLTTSCASALFAASARTAHASAVTNVLRIIGSSSLTLSRTTSGAVGDTAFFQLRRAGIPLF